MKKLLIATAIAAATASTMASAVTVSDGNTKMNIYGFIKGDVRYSFGENLYSGGDPAAVIGNVNAEGGTANANQTNGHINFTAQQTRLGFDLTQGTDMGDIHAVLEGDFASGGHAYAYRLRHAYVEWNGFLVGQTWTNFNSWNSWPSTLDWDGPVGHAGGFRWTQVRYTAKTAAGTASIALEQPSDEIGNLPSGTGKVGAFSSSSRGYNSTYAAANAPATKNQLPDLTAKFAGDAGMLKYAVGLMGRQFKLDNGNGVSSSKAGWGVFLSGQADLASGTTIGAGVVHGKGLGEHYMFEGEEVIDAAYYDGNGIQTLSQTGASGFIQQDLTSNSSLTLSYGYVKTGYESAYYAGTAPSNYQNGFLTYTITPVKHLTYGVEYGLYHKKNLDGKSGSASEMQFSAKYSF